MRFYADLHVHSKHSRATSRDADLEHLSWWARRKGITVVATGDFTHPVWFDELRDKLVPAEPGLFRLKPEIEREVEGRLPGACRGPVRFLLEVEISTIYKQGERTRKVHHLIYAASFDTAARLREKLGKIGNLGSDGRPILGLDSRHLLEITLESGPDAYLVPAHVWTPWFSTLGSKSGFDSVEDCYGDLAPHIFAVETGLSSDPPMNWRVSRLDRFTLVSNSDAHSPPMLGREACAFETELDYFALRRALETGEGYAGTVEFFPEEGKYHLDGHRACGVRLEPEETRACEGRCPTCGKPLTVGVMHRVEELADRAPGSERDRRSPFKCLVPLPEVLAEIHGVGPKSRTVEQALSELAARCGPELDVLERLPVEELAGAGDTLLVEALSRLRQGLVHRDAGYDGEYGVIRLFEPGEIAARKAVASLFEGGIGPRRGAAPSRPPSASVQPEAPGEPAQLCLLARPDAKQADAPVRRAPASALDGLDPEQREAAVVEGPLLILAGPGTGKTRTLTHRLAYLVGERGVAPEDCLAVTFTRRAATEMEERLAHLVPATAPRILVTTFHGLGLAIIREQARELGLERGFRIASSAEREEIACAACGAEGGKGGRLLEEISRCRREKAVLPCAPTSLDPLSLEKTQAYEAALASRGLLDFDDLLLEPLALFEERPEVARRYRERWRFVSIDEYQDVDDLQYRLVRDLAAPDRGDGAGANLCAIGDPDQSIYGFRGADVGFFLRFRDDYPRARVVHLARNYRSSRTIVEAACQAIRPSSLVPERRLNAVSESLAERIAILHAASERAEAEQVVEAIERLLGGTSYYSVDTGRAGYEDTKALSFGDFAVLYRTDAQAAPLAEALGRAGIPFQKRSHHPLAGDRVVRLLLRELSAETGPENAGATGALRTVEARLARAALALGSGSGQGKATDSAALSGAVELLRPVAALHGDDLAAFLAAVALGAEVDAWDPRAERVSLLTLHAAKGLEWPVVFLVGCEDGLVPLAWPGAEPAAVDEERRLFFVGLTRARERLFLSHARRRTLWGQSRDCRPSPFLADIEDALLDRQREREARPRPPEQMRLL